MELTAADFWKGEPQTETYKVAIPVGGQRKAGLRTQFQSLKSSSAERGLDRYRFPWVAPDPDSQEVS